jgi:protein gp37
MGENSKIEWTHHTLNPWRGCTRVSAGCARCYAETLSYRNPSVLGVWGPNGTRVVAAESAWREPLKWDRDTKAAGERRRVFCASLADWLEDWRGPMVDSGGRRLWQTPDGYWMAGKAGDRAPNPHVRPLTMDDVRGRLLELIARTPDLDWLLLTKRPEGWSDRLHELVRDYHGGAYEHARGLPTGDVIASAWLDGDAPLNIWCGTSVEDQATADERIPHLLRTPAAVRFLSVEPLLGPVNLGLWRVEIPKHREHWPTERVKNFWVIVGGESGPKARPMHPNWACSIRDQCREAGVPCFVKQLGAHVLARNDEVADWFGECGHLDLSPTERFQGAPGRVRGFRERKGGDPSEWPEDLRVRELPAIMTTSVEASP